MDEIKCLIDGFGNKIYYKTGIYKTNIFHRLDGPAYEHVSGDKYWYQNNQLHRTDGPAIEYANGTREYYLNDKLHRTDGPAIEYGDRNKEYYVNGIRLNITSNNELIIKLLLE